MPEPPKLIVSSLAAWAICATYHQNRFILFQNIVFSSLGTAAANGQTDEKEDGRTTREHYASAGHCGVAEA